MQEVDRTRRVAEVIRRELATLIAREISDPRLRSVSVNSVRISKDLKNATIYVSSLDQAESADETPKPVAETDSKPQPTVEQLLNNAAGFLRRLLSKNTDLRVTPSLRFRYDNSIQRGVEMSTLIDTLVKNSGYTEDKDDGE